MTRIPFELKRDFYISNKDELTNFNPDGAVLLNEEILKNLKNVIFRPPSDPKPPETCEWYPFVNSYYPYGSNADPLERVHHLLDTKPANMPVPKPENIDVENLAYSERDAQNLYLKSNPLSFIILGKPGMNEEDLGKQLASYWQCVYIEPQVLVQQEIDSGSRAGQCIEFNLRQGRAIGIDIILRLAEKRVKSETANHRGVVIAGLPLIPNTLYKEEHITSESAIFTAKEIFEDVVTTTLDITVPVSIESVKEFESEHVEEEEKLDEEPQLDTDQKKPVEAELPSIVPPIMDLGEDKDVCHFPDISSKYETQLSFLFNLLKKPFLLIYMISSPRDSIIRRKNSMFHIYSRKKIDLVKENTNKLLYNYFAHYLDILRGLPHDSFETYFYNVELDSKGLRHLVVLPRNFPANIEAQLDSFYYTAVNYLERRIMTHDPQYFLKVDARTSVQRMLHIIKAKLNALPVQKVVIPKRITLDETIVTDQTVEQGEGDEEVTEVNEKQLNIMEHFERLRKVGAPAYNFKWNWSDWGERCPVSLKNGLLRSGDPNISVQFMNKIFFLADEEAYLKFSRNPRPYLVYPYPRPICRIFIFGPPSCSKSSVAHCLGYLFDATVLSIGSIQLEFIDQKEKEFYAKIRQEVTAVAMQMLNEQRKLEAEKLEVKRAELIREWMMNVREKVEKLERLNIEREKELRGETKFELSSFPMAMAKTEVSDLETETSIEMTVCREELENLNIPRLQMMEYSALKRNKNKLFMHLPLNLRKRNVAIPATPNDQFVVDFVNLAISATVFEGADLIEQNMVEMVIDSIKKVEDLAVEQGKVKGGWIVDGMHCELSVLKSISAVYLPDEVIILKDTNDFEFLRERYKIRGANRFINFREFFMDIGKLDAAWRSPSQLSNVSYKNKLARDIVSEIFDKLSIEGSASDLVRDENYYAELLKFNVKWQEIEEFLTDKKLDIIEIIVTNKSVHDLMKEVIRVLEDRYRVGASPLSDKDRAEEITNTNLILDIGEGENENPPLTEINRRYGDTYHFCPVTFNDLWVLWKGKEKFAVKFQDRVYLLCNEHDYETFLFNPRDYISGKPPTKFPPPRICIIGAPASGKSTLARALANNYGLIYINYESFIKLEFNIETDETFEDLKRNVFLVEELRSYLIENNPLSDAFYANLSNFWFQEPIKDVGFVLDDFPKRPCDVEMMVTLKLIPDIIIELIVDEIKIKDALVQYRLDDWLDNISIYISNKEKAFQELLREWEENRLKKFNEILEEKREVRYAEKQREREEQDIEGGSQISFDSLADQQDVDEINRLLDIDMPVLIPEPTETVDEMKIKIDNNLTEHVEMEITYINLIRSFCNLEGVPYIQLPLDENDYEKNIRYIYYLTEDYKYRNISYFENCYDISFELADNLISCGYCFLSKYGKLCPVEYQENKNPFMSFPNLQNQFNIFPIIHRSYIYFINGEFNVEKFKKNPLLYVDINKIDYPIVPMRLAVTGPPKCGKTSLSHRIAQEYQMKVISRGQAIRYVLHFLPFSNLAQNMERVLRKGWEVTDEMVAKCVEAASIDARGVTQGVVFDGFPNTIVETRHLSYFGLTPHLVIDLCSTKDQMLECYSHDVGRRGFPKYHVNFINHLRQEWKGFVNIFQAWFDKEYQIMYKIPIEPSLWSIWHAARKVITVATFEVKHYFINCYKGWPLRLSYMQVTPLEFLERKSAYESFCPCCLLLSDVLTTGGLPPDRTGLIQWRQYFYWICNKHINLFLNTPDAFLTPYGKSPPEYLPRIINLKDCKLKIKNLYEDGFCATCYKNKTILIKGIRAYAVYYKDQTYLFDNSDCLQEFVQRPHLYCFVISFRPSDSYPILDYKQLPILGMLEQYIAREVIKAIKFVSRRRPVLPGLSISVSGAVGVGLYMKVYNKKLPADYIKRYMEASDLYYIRREKLLNYLEKMKRIINPYLHYEEPLPQFHVMTSTKATNSSSTLTQITHIVDDIINQIGDNEEILID